jgi:hypothetical protein
MNIQTKKVNPYLTEAFYRLFRLNLAPLLATSTREVAAEMRPEKTIPCEVPDDSSATPEDVPCG